MRLYILKVKEAHLAGYEDTSSVVVRAENARAARKVAAANPTGNMGANKLDFLSVDKTSCRALMYDGPEDVIVADTHWG